MFFWLGLLVPLFFNCAHAQNSLAVDDYHGQEYALHLVDEKWIEEFLQIFAEHIFNNAKMQDAESKVTLENKVLYLNILSLFLLLIKQLFLERESFERAVARDMWIVKLSSDKKHLESTSADVLVRKLFLDSRVSVFTAEQKIFFEQVVLQTFGDICAYSPFIQFFLYHTINLKIPYDFDNYIDLLENKDKDVMLKTFQVLQSIEKDSWEYFFLNRIIDSMMRIIDSWFNDENIRKTFLKKEYSRDWFIKQFIKPKNSLEDKYRKHISLLIRVYSKMILDHEAKTAIDDANFFAYLDDATKELLESRIFIKNNKNCLV